MEYFVSSYPGGARLGMSVVNRDDPSMPKMGNTIVDSVENTGYSTRNGVQAGDFIVSVNDQYVAFSPNTEVVRLLQGIIKDQKELKIRFARARPSDWQQIQRSGEVAIKEGSLSKLGQGLFKKWSMRYFKVTRETFSSSVDSVLKAKYDVDEIGRPRIAAGYPLHQGVFEIRCGDKDMILQSNSSESRDQWMHAIECALEKTFFQPLSSQHSGQQNVQNMQAQRPAPSVPQAPINELSDGVEAYLRMGREAIRNNKAHLGATSAETSISSSHTSPEERGVYKILSLSRVQAIGGPDTVISLAPNFQNPADLQPALLDYDFSLEQRALEHR
mmetsp:Transcript_22387/g.43890  ORF Transcript_22387/g.43890 Transcript_22387/m.43890 type:complete len:330 (+) Transcript_22387:367-1356(+)|eukprot:CAMPEP_0171493520 /NCGR_PEP_ID=MMETSP0958-20121227/5007_1 /TAXON_ID=87120 /ORGANISM="Aurantiochytrium limacinum, Strain ATCCMYA-1381" /LENGTH=329 /DNA_ID=CAMNT_0012027151 /DNA_START=325 /DNA_END=1314 /DNA_ORIENTATION=+